MRARFYFLNFFVICILLSYTLFYHTTYIHQLYSSQHNCSSDIPLTVDIGGNTGNNIWEYLSVYALNKLYHDKGLQPYIHDGAKDKLEELFQHLSIPAASKVPWFCKKRTTSTKLGLRDSSSIIESLNSSTSIVLEIYSARYDDIIKSGLEDVRKEMRFKPEDVEVAQKTLSEIKEKYRHPNGTEPTFVGVHYRGGDYLGLLNTYKNFSGPSSYKYYQRAMNYFTEKYPHVIFILITSDFGWLERNKQYFEGNLELTPYRNSMRSKIEDLLILSQCNHTIMNYGTFAITAAILGGGTTIAYDLKFPLDFRGPTVAMGIAGILDNWILMS